MGYPGGGGRSVDLRQGMSPENRGNMITRGVPLGLIAVRVVSRAVQRYAT
jgi:hypothetical protein